MQRFVVSAQRSGLNWFRFCFESMYGHRTPGQTSVLAAETHPEQVFVRSHDALNLSSRSKKGAEGAWSRLDPAKMNGARVLLILRDPLELFVRMADRKFQTFVSNIQFYDQTKSAERMVTYYEDPVTDPAAMCTAMAFLGVPPRDGLPEPTAGLVAAKWDEMGAASRANYDHKQSGTGGAQTKDNPTEFSHHQRSLSSADQRAVWAFLALRLNSREMGLLRRYQPDALPPPTPVDRLRSGWVSLRSIVIG